MMKKFLSISLCTALYFILHMQVYSQNLADLSGWWRLNTGDIIHILQSGNDVTAVYDPTVKCHSDELRTLFNSPILEFTTMTGRDTSVVLGSEEFYSCTRDKRLIED